MEKRENSLPVIEVPPELRGPSDEEILQQSESKDSQKRRNSAKRPSKRERLELKKRKALGIMKTMAEKTVARTENISSTIKSAAAAATAAANTALNFARETEIKSGTLSDARKKLETLFTAKKEVVAQKAAQVVKTVIHEAPKIPASGRVIRGAFGAKGAILKAEIISSADLAKKRMEEKAKKIRAALFAKKSAEAGTGIATASQSGATDGVVPMKRPRGRPRKNPLPPENP
ncbi:MAG: hypothetical protein MJY47_00290 [Fibrobacter sp.]|nr:hypothetical protein [Fibrobacter sp.]